MSHLVLFDFDGTLADSLVVALDVYNGVARELGVPVISADDAALRRMSPREALRSRGIPLWKVPRLVSAVRDGLRSRMDEIPLFPGIDAAVHALVGEGLRCGIVSSNARENVEACLGRHGVVDLEVLGAGTSLFGKASMLAKVLKKTGVAPANAIYVGDEVRDIVAAREVGMRSVAVSWGFADREALAQERPSAIVDDVADLARAVTAIARTS